MSGFQLGVFDFWDSLRDTIEIAQHAEEFGFSRIWLAEHLVGGGCSAQIPVALVAGVASSIRVGTAGVQIRFNNPALVARGFRFLESIFPGRIDAGFCAGGGKGETDLLAFEKEPAPPEDSFLLRSSALLAAMREKGPMPIPWAMGTGSRTATLAAREGIAFAYSLAHQYGPDPGDGEPGVLANYRNQFVARPERQEPYTCLVVAVSCADTEDEARRFMELPYPAAVFHVSAVGTAALCRDRIEVLVEKLSCDEAVVLARSPGLETTIRSYELLAEAFELNGRLRAQ